MLTMNSPANYKQVLAHFKASPKEVQSCLRSFEKLVKGYPWDIPISYVFARVEAVKHMTIYCGIVKLHWTDADLTRSIVDKDHMGRGRFRDLFKIVYGKPIDDTLLSKLNSAESVRDKIVHGKKWTDAQARQALIDVIDFACGFNDFVYDAAKIRPFGGDLRGFKGRKESLSKQTTHWVLRGMGIPKSASVGEP